MRTKEYQKEYYEKNKETLKRQAKEYRDRIKHTDEYKRRVKRTQVKRLYKITLEEYEEAMSISDSCQICNSMKELCYDHDHDTMKFRGVLCKKCNKGLGLLGDDVDGILKALKYIIS
jgi:hypothetical protein